MKRIWMILVPACALMAQATFSPHTFGPVVAEGGLNPIGTVAGTNTFTASLPSPLTALTTYADDVCFTGKFTNANTTGSTLNINSLGAIAINLQNGTALVSGDIGANSTHTLCYNSTGPKFILDHSDNAPSATTSHTLGASFNGAGSTLTTQVFCCITAPAGGTIQSWNITVDDGTGAGTCTSCTATVKFLRVATGTTTPGTGNSINTSGVALSTGTNITSTTLTDFTSTTVTADDVFAVQLSAVANAKIVQAKIKYQ